MEWIKASERLPEFNRDVAIRYKGQLYVGWLEKVETSTYFNMQGYDSRLSIQEIIKIEWLDESAPDTVQGQEELWDEVFDIADTSFYNNIRDRIKSKFTLTKNS